MNIRILFGLTILTVVLTVNGSPQTRPMKPSFLSRPKQPNPLGNSIGGTSRIEEVYRWRQMTFTPLENDSIIFGLIDQRINDLTASQIQENYNQYNNNPMGVTHHKDRLFITLPRRRTGIPATVTFVSLKGARGTGPHLQAYPNFRANELHPQNQPDNNRIISVYRTRVDACNRLWFVDTGSLEYPNNTIQVQPPSIWIYNLENDFLIRRFEIPLINVRNDGHGIASLTIDIDDNACDDAYAYLPDLVNYRLHVYSFRSNQIWSFSDNAFGYDPVGGNFDVVGVQYQWNDGIFSITLSERNADGYKSAYYHAMASTSEFEVSTRVLKNQTLASRSFHGTDFQFLGKRSDRGQSAMHVYDKHSGVIFYSQVSLNGIGCWDTTVPLNEENFHIIAQDNTTMIYPSDISIDSDGVLWIMSNKLPLYLYSSIDPNDYNYRVFKADAQRLIEGTPCDDLYSRPRRSAHA